jgi:hypothetical protein
MIAALRILCLAALAMGLLWIAQGLGVVDWPRSSFMIDQRPWAVRGAILCAVSAVALLALPRRPAEP